MTALAQRLKKRFFPEPHPYELFELEINRYLRQDSVLLDAGCGRTAPVLVKFKGKALRLIGIDVVEFEPLSGVELLNSDLAKISLPDSVADVVMSRSVMEHVTDPAAVYREIFRVLKPGGHFIFLTANLWDYASLIAKLVPNRFHPAIVARTEGRAERDVFAVAYRANTVRSIHKWSRRSGFEVVSVRYLGQYPSYFMFNGPLFLLATGYEKVIRSIPPLNFLQGWIFAVLRKPLH
jgi:ubiquinone/menaquinone biosynthesis C-methylase UbiE